MVAIFVLNGNTKQFRGSSEVCPTQLKNTVRILGRQNVIILLEFDQGAFPLLSINYMSCKTLNYENILRSLSIVIGAIYSTLVLT